MIESIDQCFEQVYNRKYTIYERNSFSRDQLVIISLVFTSCFSCRLIFSYQSPNILRLFTLVSFALGYLPLSLTCSAPESFHQYFLYFFYTLPRRIQQVQSLPVQRLGYIWHFTNISTSARVYFVQISNVGMVKGIWHESQILGK